MDNSIDDVGFGFGLAVAVFVFMWLVIDMSHAYQTRQIGIQCEKYGWFERGSMRYECKKLETVEQ